MKRTRTLGLIVTDIQNPFFPELVQAADQAARDLGYSIILGAAYDEHRAMHYLDLMVDRRVDRLIIAASQLSDESWEWLGTPPARRGGQRGPTASQCPSSRATTWAAHGSQSSTRRAGASQARLRARLQEFTADLPRVEGFGSLREPGSPRRMSWRCAGRPVRGWRAAVAGCWPRAAT
jgi:hypothetical protein